VDTAANSAMRQAANGLVEFRLVGAREERGLPLAGVWCGCFTPGFVLLHPGLRSDSPPVKGWFFFSDAHECGELMISESCSDGAAQVAADGAKVLLAGLECFLAKSGYDEEADDGKCDDECGVTETGEEIEAVIAEDDP
jgi:hypothetical protein